MTLKCWHLNWLPKRERRRRGLPWLIFSSPIESNKGELSGISWINTVVKMYGISCAAASCDKSDAAGNYFMGRPEWQHDQVIGRRVQAEQSSGQGRRSLCPSALGCFLQCWTCSHRLELHIDTCCLEAKHITLLNFTLTSDSLLSWLLTCRVTDALAESFGQFSDEGIPQRCHSTSACSSLQY